MEYDAVKLLKSVELIESSDELTKELRKTYATDFEMIKLLISNRLIKEDGVKLIKKLSSKAWVNRFKNQFKNK